jgi:hypothetical protein
LIANRRYKQDVTQSLQKNNALKIMAFSNFYYDVILGIKRPEMHFKEINSIFSNISMHHKRQNTQNHNLAGYFKAMVKFSLTY